MKQKNIFFIIIFFFSMNLIALEHVGNDENTSLFPRLPPREKFFGLQFETTPKKAIQTLTSAGLTLDQNEDPQTQGYVRTFTFNGVPNELGNLDGKTRLLFFRNKLIRIDIKFEPTYQNFLNLRPSFFKTLSNRFSIEKKQEIMDYYLKTHLAHLKKEEFNEEIEHDVQESIVKGKTLFFYKIKDSKNLLNIYYSFAPKQDPEGIKPELQIHYSLKEGIADLQTYHFFDYKKERRSKSSINAVPISSDYP